MRLLKGDECLERGLGYPLPSVTAVREFLERFHDRQLEKLRPDRQTQKSFIFPASAPVASLQEVQSGLVRRIARLYGQHGQPQRIATVDQDATIIESHKHAVLTNEKEWDGARLLTWHREKAGTVEHTHDEVKNAWGGGHVPSRASG